MVKNLFLIRHAEANMATKETSDFDRRLSFQGIEQAQGLGTYLETLSIELDVIYTSPALRTLETCAKMVEVMKTVPRIISSEEYYEATRNVLFAALNRVDDIFHNVAIVAHNPSIQMLYEYLTTNPQGNFSTGACAWLQLDITSWTEVSAESANSIDFYYPGSMNLQ